MNPNKNDIEHFSLKDDLAKLDAAIQDIDGVRVVVVDPITAYLGNTDSHKNADIRGLLAPLSYLADQRGVLALKGHTV